MNTEDNNLHERLLNLENEVINLKNKSNSVVSETIKLKKEKKKREPTEYNKFVSVYINEQKDLLGEQFKHKIAFSDAAKKWKEKKVSKS